ncbi:MAG: hypothetical protein D3910_16825, partial [Candidatus Electrothrix sp. ATG2]|nr:hypothetical protein [Candidatus Electrothrix sp. ATG2]
TELYWTQAHFTEKTEEKEAYLEQLVLLLNRQSRLYRLMGDFYHTQQAFGRARKIIERISSSRLQENLLGQTDIVEGEFNVWRGEFTNLLESIVVDELEVAKYRFEKQFPDALKKAHDLFENGKNQLEKQGDHQKLPEAYFQLGEVVMMQGQFIEAFGYLKKCIEISKKSGNDFRLDDAKQSYLNAIYFSGNYNAPEYQDEIKKYGDELEEKIREKNYLYPWVASRFCITQGDVLFSECYRMEDKPVSTDSSTYKSFAKNKLERRDHVRMFRNKFIAKKKVERIDLVCMFRKYIEACNYKAQFNDLSFEAGLQVLQRRIEMIPDSHSLDTLSDFFRQLWQDEKYLRDKKEELESILQLIRMRSLVLQYEE